MVNGSTCLLVQLLACTNMEPLTQDLVYVRAEVEGKELADFAHLRLSETRTRGVQNSNNFADLLNGPLYHLMHLMSKFDPCLQLHLVRLRRYLEDL